MNENAPDMPERGRDNKQGQGGDPGDEIAVTPPSPHPPGIDGFLKDAAEDIRAVLRADPAARTITEVVTSYPGLHALWFHRVAHRIWESGYRTQARIISHVARHLTGVEIHPGATIGRRVFIDHGMGVVIGETAEVGDDCLIYQGVVLGGTSLKRTKRHPTLGRGVTVGAHACILGAVEVGDGARIGSGSVVIKDVEAGGTAVGIPGRVVSREEPSSIELPDLDHAELPDPLQRIVGDLLNKIDQLSSRIHTLESMLDLSPEELAEKLERTEQQSELELEYLDALEEGASDPSPSDPDADA